MARKKAKNISDVDILRYADKVLDAVNNGATDEQALFFLSTFKRYKAQLQILDKIEATLLDPSTSMLTEKEYIKDKTVVQSNPLLATYNTTCSAANTTVKTLISIIKQLDTATIGTTADDEFDAFLKM